MANEFKKGNKIGEKWTEAKSLELADELIDWIRTGEEENIFFEYFLLVVKGLYKDLLKDLSKKHPAFKVKIEQARSIQKIKLIKYGVADELNASMTKFCLINNHGMKDKVENTVETVAPVLSKEDRKERLKELREKASE